MTDNVVFLGGKAASEPQDMGLLINKAIREVFLSALQSFRKGEIRGAIIITIDTDKGSTFRIGGNCSDHEVVSALEYTKLKVMIED